MVAVAQQTIFSTGNFALIENEILFNTDYKVFFQPNSNLLVLIKESLLH